MPFESKGRLLLFAGLGCVLVVALGVAAALPRNSAVGDEGRLLISITSTSYEPHEMFITAGTEVTWTNADTKEHWPASNNHPTHTVYPGSGIQKCGTAEAADVFDACRGLAQGESWSFVFNDAGAWAYHDHLFPSRGGTIRVFKTESERDAAYAAATQFRLSILMEKAGMGLRNMAKLVGLSLAPEMPSLEQFRALSASEQQAAITRLAEYDAARAWKYLKDAAFVHNEQVLEAHELSHIVGNALYREHGFEGIGVCDPTFAFGCYHGVAEKFLEEEGPAKTADAAATCKKIFPEDARFQQYSSCVHGLGHGLLAWYALDLRAALLACKAVPQDVQTHCFDGAFMEFSFSASREQYPVAHPWTLCTDLGEEYHIACARYQPELMRSILGLSTEEIAGQCLAAGAHQLQEHCIGKLGFEAAWHNPESAEAVISSCSTLFSGHARRECLTAAAREFVFQQFPDWSMKSARLCSALSGSEKNECMTARDLTMQQYGR